MGFRWRMDLIVMASKAARAEAKIANICQTLGITQSGHFWMDHAVDPFKDLIKPHPGYPDKTSNPSVTEIVKKSVTVTAPGVVNWDASIFLDQVLQQVLCRSTSELNSYIEHSTGQGAVDYARGGLVVRTGSTGASLDITTTQNALCSQVDTNLYTNEDCRVVSIGFEVHDTTQELKKQGSVCVWRIDQPVEQPVVTNCITDPSVACIPSAVETFYLPNPPALLSEALDMVGSRQWEAKEGAYVVPTQVQDTNPPMALRRSAVRIVEPSGPTVYYPQISNNGAANLKLLSSSTTPNPWSMCGAFFSGLDPAASLTINFNFVIERFPNKTSGIRRLCYPSPEYDPKCMELYSIMARSMPVGVPVSENGLGDWLMGIANIAAGALSVIPHPIPKMIGAGLTMVGNNKQVQLGTKQILDKVEKKIEKKMIEGNNQLALVENGVKCGIVPISSMNTQQKNYVANHVREGNYIAPTRRQKRTNRLADLARKEAVPNNPWVNKKEKK